MKTLAVMMAALLAGGCASVQSPAGWRPQNDAATTMNYDWCLAKAYRVAAEVNETEEVKADEDVLKSCMKDRGHSRAVSPALVTTAKIVGLIIFIPLAVVVVGVFALGKLGVNILGAL